MSTHWIDHIYALAHLFDIMYIQVLIVECEIMYSVLNKH